MSRYLLAALVVTAQAEIVDRVAVNIGHAVVSESQVVEQVRIQSFIDGTPLDLSFDSRRKALDRLIEQALVRRELEFTRFSSVSAKDVEPALLDIRDRHGTPDQFRDDLNRYGITADQLKAHITWTLTMLRFIEYRFQPSVQINDVQVQQEYQRQAGVWKQQRGSDMAPLEQVRPDIERIVRQRLVDSALDRWLGEVRTQNDIIYRGEYKQ